MPSCVKSVYGGANLEITEDGFFSFSNSNGCWNSKGPLFILNYYDRQHPRAQSVSLPSNSFTAFGTAGTLSLSCIGEFECREKAPGEIQINGTFKQAQLSLSFILKVESDGSGFRVIFSDKDIREGHPSLYRVLSVEILPQFNGATTGEEGYLVLPNWTGIRMFFNKKVSRELRQTVYSSNDQWEYCCNMPVFGTHRDNGTMCGLISQGEYDAKLVCRQHYEEEHINSVHPEMVLRWEQQDDMIDGMREVKYSFAIIEPQGGDAYVYIAKKYRELLYQEKGLMTWAQKAEVHPEVLQYRDSFMLKFFMGYKEPHSDGHGKYHATTTFGEVREILEDLLANGVKRICAVLVGWNIDGHDGMPPTRMPVDERLGGEGAMRELVKWCKDKDIMLSVHDSYGAAYPCSPEFNIDELIRHRSGEYWESIIWSGGQAHKICPSVYIEKYVPRDLEDVSGLGIHGHHHIDAVGSFMPCFSEQHPLPLRRDNIECNRKMFKLSTETMGSVSTELPFGSYFDVVDGLYHCYKHPSAWHLACKAALFRDESIPLLNIALHGSVKLCSSLNKADIPDLAEWAIAPQWEVSTRPAPHFGIYTYSDARDKLIEAYRECYSDNGYCLKTEALLIDSYQVTDDGTHIFEFEGGMIVETNIKDNSIKVINVEKDCLV